jgi:putative membrane protein
MAQAYLWVKALHVISIITWMAGLLYLPRLFVYHAAVDARSPASESFKVMERKLLRLIMNPAMIASFITGGLLIWMLSPGIWSEGWLHGKLALVAAMAVMHGMMAKWRRDFATDRNSRSHRFFRWMNEVPTLLMIGIVVLVVVKPF